MLAIDDRPHSRTRGHGLDAPSRPKRRFVVPATRASRLEKRDMTIHTLRTKHGYLIADLADLFGLSARHVKSILADVNEYLEACADDI